MKKFYQIISTVALSALVMGATAQNMRPAGSKQMRSAQTISHAQMKQMPVLHQVANAQSSQQNQRILTQTHVDVMYYNTDATTIYPGTTTLWAPPAYTNMRYGLADSGSGTAKNYNMNHSGIVAFDTILDINNVAYNPPSGTLTVDTIYMWLGYHNTSNTNDTMIIHIGQVGANGYPTATNYTTDTVIVPPHSAALPGNVLDSVYGIYIIPNRGLGFNVPAAAPLGYKYNVTVATYGSKMDTLGLQYGSPYGICSAQYFAMRTGCGPAMGQASNVNSFMTGFQFYNSAAYGGNGSVLTWPNAAGDIYNSAFTFGDYWFTPAGCPGDTGFMYTQDLLIECGVTFGTPTAVNNIASQGFSVAQNYPNPFNQNTVITYNLPKASNVVFTVNDITGRELVNTNYSTVAAGQHEINMQANQFTPGVYFYTFNVNGVKVTKRMVIAE